MQNRRTYQRNVMSQKWKRYVISWSYVLGSVEIGQFSCCIAYILIPTRHIHETSIRNWYQNGMFCVWWQVVLCVPCKNVSYRCALGANMVHSFSSMCLPSPSSSCTVLETCSLHFTLHISFLRVPWSSFSLSQWAVQLLGSSVTVSTFVQPSSIFDNADMQERPSTRDITLPFPFFYHSLLLSFALEVGSIISS